MVAESSSDEGLVMWSEVKVWYCLSTVADIAKSKTRDCGQKKISETDKLSA